MPNEITDGYQIKCLSCGYVWNTKYAKIPAKCPSCNGRIYGTGNYNVHTRYIHHEKTEEEKKQTRRTIGMTILGFMIFISLISNWFFGFFLFSAILGLWIYRAYKESKEKSDDSNLKNEKTVEIPLDKKEVKTVLTCPKCGKSFEYDHKIGNEGSLTIPCKYCNSELKISTKRIREFKCEYCSKKFKTKIEAENHEKKCKKKKDGFT